MNHPYCEEHDQPLSWCRHADNTPPKIATIAMMLDALAVPTNHKFKRSMPGCTDEEMRAAQQLRAKRNEMRWEGQ